MKVFEMLKKHDNAIKQKYGVKKIGVFGSFARGEGRKDSDIDVLVEFKDSFETFDNYMELKFFLEDLFGRKVDLVTIEALRPQLKEDIFLTPYFCLMAISCFFNISNTFIFYLLLTYQSYMSLPRKARAGRVYCKT